MAVTVESHGTIAEAQHAIGSDAVYLGGGTIVMRNVNAGLVQGRLVRSTDPALSEVRPTADGFEVGAAVTMAAIAANQDLAFLHPVVRTVGGPQVRNMATIGGNLFAEHPYGDLTGAMLALGARIVTAGRTQRAIDDFLRERMRAGLVVSIQVPRPRDARAFGFLKVSRVKPKGVSVMSLAVNLPREGGRLRGVRVAYVGFGPAPVRAHSVERVLEGGVLDTAMIARAAQLAADGLEPPTDALASAWYRSEVVGVHLRRLLERML
jgi:CO/xanthine dehydrogenase FAD-binding subunit